MKFSNVVSHSFSCSILQTANSDVSVVAHQMATKSREQARKLQTLPHSERKSILYAVADALEAKKDALLAANKIDLDAAERDGTDLQLVRRLISNLSNPR